MPRIRCLLLAGAVEVTPTKGSAVPVMLVAAALVLGTHQARAQTETIPAETALPAPTAAAPSGPAGPCPTDATCHGGFYLRASAPGIGYLSLAGQGPAGHASLSGVSFSGSVAMGGTPLAGFVVGGMIRLSVIDEPLHDGQAVSASGANVYVERWGALVDWYPSPALGWHLGVELGADLSEVSIPGGLSMTGLGFGGTIFAGYDWWVLPQWSLGLALSASTGTVESMVDSSGNDMGYRLKPTDAAVDLTILFH